MPGKKRLVRDAYPGRGRGLMMQSLRLKIRTVQIKSLSMIQLDCKKKMIFFFNSLTSEMSIYIRIGEMHRFETLGLCGTFDGLPDNDFLSPANITMGTACAFGDSWVAMDCGETDCLDYAAEVRLIFFLKN